LIGSVVPGVVVSKIFDHPLSKLAGDALVSIYLDPQCLCELGDAAVVFLAQIPGGPLDDPVVEVLDPGA
jgi:hypothetical protein